MKRSLIVLLLVCLANLLAACAEFLPAYDVPSGPEGPSAKSIVDRVTCELARLVDGGGSPHEELLLTGDYDVAINFSLDTNDTGSISPNFGSLGAPFTFSGGFTLSRSVERNFFATFDLSFRDLARRVRRYGKVACPPYDTNLAGNLGISDTVSMGIFVPGTKRPASLTPSTGEFGTYIYFTVKKSIDNTGPAWTFKTYKAGGGFINASDVNSDKITIAFAQGPNAGTPFDANGSGPINIGPRAQILLQQLINNEIVVQLNGIRTEFRQ